VTYDGYVQTFQNLTGATQAGDYMTFGLVNTVDGELQLYIHDQPTLKPTMLSDCIAMCNRVQGCGFVNSTFSAFTSTC